MSEIDPSYKPYIDLELDPKFNEAYRDIITWLASHELTKLKFLINRAYFVGYNQGYDDAKS
jgi:hypothetical protein